MKIKPLKGTYENVEAINDSFELVKRRQNRKVDRAFSAFHHERGCFMKVPGVRGNASVKRKIEEYR